MVIFESISTYRKADLVPLNYCFVIASYLQGHLFDEQERAQDEGLLE